MPAPFVRKAIWAIVAASVAIVLVLASLPLVASTQIVRTRISQELSARSGFRVTLGEAPDLDLFPSLKAVLHNVTFSRWEDAGAPPVLETERLEANLSAWRALIGGIDFSTIVLERPVLRVERAGDRYYLPFLPGRGRVAEILRAAATGDARDGPALGTIRFSEGRLVSADTGQDIATSLTGTAQWETANSPALLNGGGVWRGESVRYALMIEAPLKLAGRDASAVTVSFESDPFNASFSGTASRREGLTFDGSLAASSPSARRALEWSQAQIGPGAAMGAFSLSGKATGGRDTLKLADARLSINENPGVGALELAFAKPVPSISGTLAFDTLDIGHFLSAFATPLDQSSRKPVFDLTFTDQISLDLRVSAGRATGGGIQLSDVAATAQVRGGFAAFDISDATGLGGEIQAGFRVDRKPEGEVGEMRVSAEGIDWAELAARIGWSRNAPRAKGSLNVVLRSPITDMASLPYIVQGTIGAKLGPGALKDFDLAKLIANPPGGGFFPLSAVGGGSLAIEGAEFKAAVQNGVARIETAKAWTAKDLLNLDGIVPYVGRSLALSLKVGRRDASQDQGGPAPAQSYFVGGSWDAPYVSAVLAPVGP
ncbi:MAG: AsmA family protein [Mesorhizobium sp.]|nr:AsmA-like C-terminal region-containing protein [Mesorhizobium sp.]MCO5160366.1 AsmA family protein [Mesorhizobium sp.]